MSVPEFKRRSTNTDNEIEKIAHRIIMELETASSKNLADVHYAKTILQLSDLHYTNKIFPRDRKCFIWS